VNKIAIIDFDVHHGNGTQNTFYNAPNILYISLHQYPFFPGSGAANEIGAGEGEGYTVNIPMRYGVGDDDYRKAFADVVVPAIDKFAPELTMISSGFDGHRDDPLASLNLSTKMYSEMTRMLVDRARKYCRGRIVSCFEGGYHPAALEQSVRCHLEELASD
jgi:acetoin utilization deacetylase AcuC-like enzyme